MRISRLLAEDLLLFGKIALPCEAVGLVFGRNGIAQKFVPLDNKSANPLAFEFSQIEFENALKDNEEPLCAFFHTHPTDIPAPSTLDIEGAGNWPRTPHLILSLTGTGPLLRCWRIFDGQAMPEEIEYVDATG